VVIVCDAGPVPSDLRAAVGEAGFVHEDAPGALSERLGRPSYVVCDEYLDVTWHGRTATAIDIADALEQVSLCIGRCPGAAEERGSDWATG
jgi:hypothetical protein